MDGIEAAEQAVRECAGHNVRDRGRVIVERVWPEIDGGRFPIKRTVGQHVTVSADIFADGHDALAGVVKYRHVLGGPPSVSAGPPSAGPALRTSTDRPARRTSNDSRPGSVAQLNPRATDPATTDPAWQEIPLVARHNDRWEAAFTVSELGEYEYTIEAWIDRFGSWLKGLVAKADAGQDVSSELLEGADLIQAAASAAMAGPPSAAVAGRPSPGDSRSAGPALRTSIDSPPSAAPAPRTAVVLIVTLS